GAPDQRDRTRARGAQGRRSSVERPRPCAVRRLRAGQRAALCLRHRRRAWRRQRRRRVGGRRADLPRHPVRGAEARPGAAGAGAGRRSPEQHAELAAGRSFALAPRLASMASLSPDLGRRELTFAAKLRGLQWGLVLLVAAISGIGFAMLYSAANGSLQPWASRQMTRFALAFIPMLLVAMVDVRHWFRSAYWNYGIS